MCIEILNIRRHGWPTEPYDFKIDRTTPVGNPYELTNEKDRDLVCEWYEEWFNDHLMNEELIHSDFSMYVMKIREVFRKYGKVRLFCWCSPRRCHGEVIKKHIEAVVLGRM